MICRCRSRPAPFKRLLALRMNSLLEIWLYVTVNRIDNNDIIERIAWYSKYNFACGKRGRCCNAVTAAINHTRKVVMTIYGLRFYAYGAWPWYVVI